MKWAEPENMHAWSGRLFTVGPFFILLAGLFLLISELRFDWVEHVLGTYLAQTNSTRPESGHIWEIDHKAQKAKKTVEQIVTDRLAIQRETLDAESMSELASRIDPGAGVMMSPEHFRKVYLRFPAFISDKILPPMELLKIFSEGEWVRTYCEKAENGLVVYLLGADNRVLREIEIDKGYLEQIDSDSEVFEGSLDELPDFRDRIIPAGLFLETLSGLPEDIKTGILPDPAMLLKTPGRLTRVGFPGEIANDLITVGFEFESDEGGVRVVRKKALGWAVSAMNSAMAQNGRKQTDEGADDMQRGEP